MRALLALTILLGFAHSAVADLAPPPEVRERAYAEQIRKAGFKCAEPVTFDDADTPRADALRERSLVPVRVECAGGAAYLVANPRRFRGRAASDASSRPTPVVERWR